MHLAQKSVQANVEKVRVHSVRMRFHAQILKGTPMDYASFWPTRQQVSGVEDPRYNQRNWSALTSHSHGSFVKHLAEDKLQAMCIP